MINECMQCVHQQFKPMGVGRKQMQCIDHSPAEIWFAQWEIQDGFLQEILVPKKSSSSAPDQLSSWAAVARWRGGEGCSHPAAHQIVRSTVSNILGNSWGLPIHALRVVWNFSLQRCRRLSPPFWLRLDCSHCIPWRDKSWRGEPWVLLCPCQGLATERSAKKAWETNKRLCQSENFE